MKKTRTLLITLVIFLLLIVALFLLKNKKTEVVTTSEPSSTAPSTIKVIDLKIEDVEEITVADTTQSLTYATNNGTWYVKGNEKVPINTDTLNYKCERILQIEATRTIENTNLQELGLAAPSQTVTYTLKDGQTIELLLGTKTQDTTYTYVKLNTDNSPVYLISSLISNSFTSNINDLRDFKLAEYETRNITGLTIKGQDIPDMKFTLSKEQNSLLNSFVLDTDTLHGIAIDPSAFDTLTKTFPTTIKVEEYIADGVTDLSSYGLDKPKLHLIIELTETDTTTQKTSERTLDYMWGNTLENGQIAFMKTGDTSVYSMDGSFLEALLKEADPFKLSYKWIALLNIDTVKAVNLHFPNNDYSLTLDLEKGAYTLNDKSIDEKTLKSLYATIIDIKADTLIEDTSLPTDESPSIYFTYTFKDGTTKTVNFYKYNELSLLGTLHDAMTVSCSLKQFNYLEQTLKDALAKLN